MVQTRQTSYRGRLAPSPTGLLHLGHARTFWIACQRARESGGVLVYRNEDLDPQRSRVEYVRSAMDDLRWLGIEWQEGPDVGGPFAPYSQSERRDHYLAVWRQLRDSGDIYPCTCSRKELADMAQAPHADDEPLYPGKCRPAAGTIARADAPAGVNWRFRVEDGERIAFQDGSAGEQAFTAGVDFGDFLVWRRDDVPSYQLAVVADDAAMQITEVVRGMDLLKSTARQLLLFRALDIEAPAYFHCELMTDATGARLAKRSDSLSLSALREAGRTPGQIREMFGL
jgi:glutamyl-tRNA synthetase